ncbi:MAG TPA: SPFH domain-containing protein [Chromatiaceae bacterium]|nr:SPFH domain-containing protein [Chromatiaceae bacterium]
MGLWDKFFGEFVDVIEWLDDSNDTMVYRFERYGNEIKYGAKLTVRESQNAVFVNEGQVADVLGPGMYELETKNLPVLSTLQHWDHGFESPFKAEVYFCNMRRFTDLKWGTKNPLMLRDKEFGGVRLRAFGSYVMRIADPKLFIQEITGTDGHFTTDEISNQLRNLITSRFASIVGKADIPVLDLAANYEQLGDFITERIAPEFSAYGLELTKMLIENISLPPEVEAALDKRTSMGMIGNLDKYLKFQTAEAMQNSGAGGGAMSDAMGMGVGMAMAGKMAESLHASSGSATPPPLPGQAAYHVAIDGKTQGPFGADELKRLAADGKLGDTTLVWTDGMSDWRPAAEVDALKPLLGPATPPPLPPR